MAGAHGRRSWRMHAAKAVRVKTMGCVSSLLVRAAVAA